MDEPALFRNRFRIASARCAGWDYASGGSYFVTICTKGKIRWLGDVCDQQMCLSEIGEIVRDEWLQTEKIRNYVDLDEFVVMPDHFHGIITIRTRGCHGNRIAAPAVPVETPWHGIPTNANHGIPTNANHGIPTDMNPYHHPQWKSGCLGAIIQQFKRACTKRIRNAGHMNFAWQPRFHDRIIRNDDEMGRIRRYIAHNPSVWKIRDSGM